MIDIDGKFSYSKTVSVRLSNSGNAIMYPNPTNGFLTLLMDKPLTVKSVLRISDIAGRIIAEQNVNALQNNVGVDVRKLPAGRYFITIKNVDELIKESFIIIK